MIESMRLERFKNFHDATLRLGPLTAIVGTNASGKSNLRDAFRFIHGMSRGYGLAEIIGEKYVEGGVLQWKGIRGGTRETASFGSKEFTLTTTVQRPNDMEPTGGNGHDIWHATHSITVTFDDVKSGPRVARERLSDDFGMIFDSHPPDDPPAQEEPEYLFVRMPRDETNRKHGKRLRFLSSIPIISQFAQQSNIERYSKPAGFFLDALRSMQFLDLSPTVMRVPSFPGQVVLGDRGENLSSVLQAICQDTETKNAITEWIRELTPMDVVSFEFVPDQTGRVLVSLVDSHGQSVSAYSASDGTLRFLALIAALLGPDPARLYFLEEIDNGIHPTRLYLLLQLIEQRVRGGRVQIVTTTHSPQLLGMLSAEAREYASLVYCVEGFPYAEIRRVMEIPSVREVLEKQSLSRLHESGWLENVMAFTQPEAAES